MAEFGRDAKNLRQASRLVHLESFKLINTEDFKCLICLDFQEREVIVCANCWKYFCQDCLDIWLKKRVDCPHCRVSFLLHGVKKAYNFKEMILKASYYDYMMNFVHKIGLGRKAKCQTICSKHDNCYLSKYCLDCRQCVCSHCIMSNEHSGHKFKSINRGYMYHLIKIVNNLPVLKDRASLVLTEIEVLLSHTDQISSCEACLQKIQLVQEFRSLEELYSTIEHAILEYDQADFVSKAGSLMDQLGRHVEIKSIDAEFLLTEPLV